MYCKNCGCKLSGKETKCPNCGAEGQPIEYTNGFWDLYQGKPNAVPSAAPGSGAETNRLRQEVGRLEQQIRRLYRSQHTMFRIYSGAALVLLVLIILLFFRSCSQGRDIAKLSADYENLSTTVHAQAEQVAQLSDTVQEQEKVLDTLNQDPYRSETEETADQGNQDDGVPEDSLGAPDEEEGTETADSGTTSDPGLSTDPADPNAAQDSENAADPDADPDVPMNSDGAFGEGLPAAGSTGVQPGAGETTGADGAPVV